ncbi:MAG TPA: N-acetylglucosamine-6-phosphate deacetylase [Chitinophagaceae bacterium]
MPENGTWNARLLFTGREWLARQSIKVENGRITAIVPAEAPGTDPEAEMIIPAFIDLQIYGASSRLYSVFPDAETLSLIHQFCVHGGAYWFQPTVATNTLEVFRKAIDGVRVYRQNGGEGCLGLHLEGPWINPDKRGAHIGSLVHPPSIDEVRSLLNYGEGVISMITLAPEVCSEEVINTIRSAGVVISAGHTNADFRQANDAFLKGIHAVTHLYNAMSGLQHRQPGMVGAAMLHEDVMAGIIADGHHVDFAAITIARRLMKNRLFLITDAVTETGLGAYRHQREGDKFVADGILSGSAVNMLQSVKNLLMHTDTDLDEAIRMASLYPAKAVGLAGKIGCIEVGAAARFILTDESLSAIQVV